jgi:hypothetical protein
VPRKRKTVRQARKISERRSVAIGLLVLLLGSSLVALLLLWFGGGWSQSMREARGLADDRPWSLFRRRSADPPDPPVRSRSPVSPSRPWPSIPAPPPTVGASEVEAFLSGYVAAGESSDPMAQYRCYAPEVDYFGDRKSRSTILADYRDYIGRWPDRDYTVLGFSSTRKISSSRWETVMRMRHQTANRWLIHQATVENAFGVRVNSSGELMIEKVARLGEEEESHQMTNYAGSALRQFAADWVRSGGSDYSGLKHHIDFYADRVDYLEHGIISRNKVGDNQRAWRDAWPLREYRMGTGLSIRYNYNGIFLLDFRFHYRRTNLVGDSESGWLDVDLAVATSEDQPEIIYQRAAPVSY